MIRKQTSVEATRRLGGSRKIQSAFKALWALSLFLFVSVLPVNAQVSVIHESFDNMDGKGGNDGVWNYLGSGTDTPLCEAADLPEGWTLLNQYVKGSTTYKGVRKGNGCVIVGVTNPDSKATTFPYIQTPPLNIGEYTVTFVAGLWNTTSEKTDMNIKLYRTDGLVSEGTTTPFTLTKGKFKTCTATLNVKEANAGLRFVCSVANSNNRFFIDRVDIVPVGTVGSMEIKTAEGYGTFYSDRPVIMPEGVKGAIVSNVDGSGKLVLDWKYPSGAAVPANTGLLIYADEQGTYPCIEASEAENAAVSAAVSKSEIKQVAMFTTVNAGVDEAVDKVGDDVQTEEKNDITTNYLYGTITDETTPGDVAENKFYQLTYGTVDGERKLGFFFASEDGGPFVNKANKAYLMLPRGISISNSFALGSNDGELSAVSEISGSHPNSAEIYTLTGLRVSAGSLHELPSGVYIVNGQKKYIK